MMTRRLRWSRACLQACGLLMVPAALVGTAQAMILICLAPAAGYGTEIISTDAGASSAPLFAIWHGRSDGAGVNHQRFGHLGLPQPGVNIMGNVADPEGGAVTLEYSLNGRASHALALGSEHPRLELPGDFVTEIPFADLVAGANTLVLQAQDASGSVALQTVMIDYTPGEVAPCQLKVEWSQLSDIQDGCQLVDGEWEIAAGVLRPRQWGRDRRAVIGDLLWTDYEVELPITVYSIDPAGYDWPGYCPSIGLGMRWTGHAQIDSDQSRGSYLSAGAFAGIRWLARDSNQWQLRTGESKDEVVFEEAFVLGVTYLLKCRVESGARGVATYRFKAWKVTDDEPAAWMMQVQGQAKDPQAGSLLLIASHVDADFGTIIVTPLDL